MSVPLVIYHFPCFDGWCAGWIMDRCYKGVQLFPANYGDEPPPVSNRTVFVVDFSYPREVMLRMADEANNLLVLDHHKSSQEDCRGLPFCIFDMNKSGAWLAYEHCVAEKLISNVERVLSHGMRELARYVQDHDLFRFELQNSKVITAAIRSRAYDLEEWDRLARQMSLNSAELVIEGIAIQRYRERQIEVHVEHAVDLLVAGYRVPVVQITTPDITSDVLQTLARNQPFAMSYVIGGDGICYCSLRSDQGGMDVSEIAKRFGGGGHKHAAGFRVEYSRILGFDPDSGVNSAPCLT